MSSFFLRTHKKTLHSFELFGSLELATSGRTIPRWLSSFARRHKNNDSMLKCLIAWLFFTRVNRRILYLNENGFVLNKQTLLCWKLQSIERFSRLLYMQPVFGVCCWVIRWMYSRNVVTSEVQTINIPRSLKKPQTIFFFRRMKIAYYK